MTMADNPLVSIIVPTYNLKEPLRDAVTSLLAQDYPRFEVIVVDNNCTDGTCEMVTAMAGEDPRLRYCLETAQGVTRARNRGCQEAQGDLLAFVDHDEVAPPWWLSKLVSYQQETGAGGVGGPYEPIWEVTPPRWLERSRCMQETLSFVDFGSERRKADWVPGGNCLYTRRAIEDADYFGRWASYTSKRSLVGGDDIIMGERIRRAGYEIWFDPTAIVGHRVPPSRMRLSYILRRAFWAGYTDVALGQTWKLGNKSGKALRRGPDAVALGLVILPGILYGRLAVRLGFLDPREALM
jgi:glycosyltransferase involved in cell wall biosynthesis